MKILYINSCVRDQSRTSQLGEYLLSKLDGDVEQIVLQSERLKPLDGNSLDKRNNLLSKGLLSDDMFKYANQFASADVIVISAPFWDLAFPALLKIYLEQITVCGITFKYSDMGVPQGLCKAKQLYYITTAGGPVFCDFGYSYVKSLATTFFGIDNTKCFLAQNLDVVGVDVQKQIEMSKEDIDKNFD